MDRTGRDREISALKDRGLGVMAISRETGIPKSSVTNALQRIRIQGPWGAKPRITITAAMQKEAANGAPVSNEIRRVTAIPDTHFAPEIDPARMKWVGRHVAAMAPDAVVHIGDLGEFSSLCSHVPNDTFGGKLKPSFMEDVVACDRGLGTLAEEMAGMKRQPDLHVTLGNHDHRMWTFENSAPEIAGMMQEEFLAVLRRYGWQPHTYGEPLALHGVRYVHIPFNIMGRPVGGKFAGQTIARESVYDVVHGHTHRHGVVGYPKLFGERTTVVDVGACMPDGHRPDFAANTQGEWSQGVVDIIQRNGKIAAVSHVPMFELERRYG